MNAVKGFTLIELMIVVAIIAIISVIAYPSYQDSVLKANRAEGLETITDTAGRLERCYTTYGSYDNASCPIANGATIASKRALYDVGVESAAATYKLTATAKGSQVKDTKCATFVLDNTGKKSSTPTGNTCW